MQYRLVSDAARRVVAFKLLPLVFTWRKRCRVIFMFRTFVGMARLGEVGKFDAEESRRGRWVCFLL